VSSSSLALSVLWYLPTQPRHARARVLQGQALLMWPGYLLSSSHSPASQPAGQPANQLAAPLAQSS
jgi:hypothetical protein